MCPSVLRVQPRAGPVVPAAGGAALGVAHVQGDALGRRRRHRPRQAQRALLRQPHVTRPRLRHVHHVHTDFTNIL